MKILKLLFCSIFLFSSLHVYAVPKNGLSEEKINGLVWVGKVWGFLKYHSPVVANGKLDWDSVLIVSIRKITAQQIDSNYLNDALTYLVVQAKATGENKNAYHVDNIDSNSRWITNKAILGKQVSDVLVKLYFSPKSSKNYYVTCKSDNPFGYYFCNEKSYEQFDLPPLEYRLLCLFRYWNIVNYFYPYRNMINNYDQSLYDLIPVMYNVSSVKEYAFSIWKMSSYIEDSHGELAYKGFGKLVYKKYYAPFEVRVIEDQIVITDIFIDSYNVKNPLKVGDILISMPDMPALNVFIDSFSRYMKFSNEAYTKYYISNFYPFSSSDSIVNLKVLRNGKEITVNAEYYRIGKWQDLYMNYFNGNIGVSKIINGNVGYVNLSKIRMNQVDSIFKALAITKAIIFDMRGYPFVPWDPGKIVNYLLTKRVADQKYWEPDFLHPGRFIYGEEKIGPLIKRRNYYKGQIIVLVNERTKSAAEGTVMMLQSTNRAITIGSQTAGTNGVSASVNLPGYARINITQYGISYPDGTPMQRVGVKIDYIIKPTIKGLSEGKDEVVAKALEIIEQK